MIFRLTDFDQTHYASNLRDSDTMLKWDARGHTHHLIIRAQFGTDIRFGEADGRSMEKLGSEQILSGREMRLDYNRFFVMLPKGYTNNYQFPASPASYAVFCCVYSPEDDVCTLYVPNDACLYQCAVSANIEISLAKDEEKPGLLSRVFGGKGGREYYTVKIPLIPGYSDGELYYSFSGCKYRYPITGGMLDKPVSIPAYGSSPPQIAGSTGNGYKISIKMSGTR